MATKNEERAPKAADFSIGDMVRMNCSSMKMTVHSINPDRVEGAIECRWFRDDGDMLEACFHPAQLVIARKAEA